MWRTISLVNTCWTIFIVYSSLELSFWIPIVLGTLLLLSHYLISTKPKPKQTFSLQCGDRYLFFFITAILYGLFALFFLINRAWLLWLLTSLSFVANFLLMLKCFMEYGVKNNE